MGGLPLAAQATNPQQDLKEFRAYFMERFPDTEFQDFANGVYSIDSPSRAQRESIEEFPPYELAVDEGREMWGTPFPAQSDEYRALEYSTPPCPTASR